MPGITRVHGTTSAGGFYGLQPLIFLVGNSANTVGTADTLDGNGLITAEGNFTKAVRAIQERASIVFLGPRSNAGFCVFVDNTANPYVSANTDTDVAAALVAAIEAATGLTDVSVTAKTLAFAQFA